MILYIHLEEKLQNMQYCGLEIHTEDFVLKIPTL